jgi:membrane-associated phospholipid phosphatase
VIRVQDNCSECNSCYRYAVAFFRPPEGAELRETLTRAFPLFGALAVLIVGLWGFGVLVEDLLTGDPIVQIDRALAAWLHDHASSVLTPILVAVTTLGSAWVLAPLAVVAVALLLRRHRGRDALMVALAIVGAELLTVGLKAGFERERPFFADPLAVEGTFSFPSGHATVSLAVYGALAIVMAKSRETLARRIAVLLAAAALILLIGFSRLYLGVHFLSDVLAGFSAGLAWLGLCTLAIYARRGWASRASA